MRYAVLLVILVVVSTMMAAAPAPQFRSAELDTKAAYVARFTVNKDGTWQQRETYKLCKLPSPLKGKRGEAISYAVVAPTRECPK